MNCIYNFKHKNFNYVFSSEQELNAFLINNRARLNLIGKFNDINFSLEFSPQDEVVAKIEAIKDNEFKNGKYIGVTTIITSENADTSEISTSGDEVTISNKKIKREKPLVTGFNFEEYKEHKTSLLQEERIANNLPELSQVEIDDHFNNLEEEWARYSNYGTLTHKVPELYFKNPGSTLDDILKAVNADGIKISRDNLSTIYDYFFNFHKYLKLTYGEDCKILSEVEVRTKNNDINLKGIIDLIVIDKEGNHHIFDFKISPVSYIKYKQPKVLTFDYQLGLYNQILKQNGITSSITSLNIVPLEIQVTEDGFKIINDINYKNMTVLKRNDINDTSNNFNKPYFKENLERYVSVNEMPFNYNTELGDEINSINYEMFGYETNNKIHTKSLESFIKHNITQDNDGKWGYYDRIKQIGKTIRVNFNTREEAITSAKEYKAKEAAITNIHSLQIAEDYRIALAHQAFNSTNPSTTRLYNRFFQRYLNKGYTLNDSLIAHNILIFTHNATKTVEFVTITNRDITTALPLAKGTKVVGNLIDDNSVHVDNYILDSNVGNIELMRTMATINEFLPSFNDDWAVQDIHVLDVNTQTSAYQSLDILQRNFTLLTKLYNRKSKDYQIVNNFESKKIQVLDYVTKTINQLDSIVDGGVRYPHKLKEYRKILSEANDKAKQIKILYEMLTYLTDTLTDKNKSFTDVVKEINPDDKLKMLYLIISDNIRALNDLYYVYQTTDITKWSLHSDLIAPAQLSPNKFIQEINSKLLAVARSNAKKIANPILTKNKTMGEDYIRKKGKLDTSTNAFDSIIDNNRENPDMPYFRIKNPDKIMDPVDKQYAEYFLKTLNAYRYPDTDGNPNHPEAQQYIADGRWYDIPITPGGFYNRGISFETISQTYNDFKEKATNLFMVQGEDFKSEKERQEMLFNKIINPLRSGEGDFADDRKQVLMSKSANYYSRDLSEILNAYCYESIMEDEFNTVLPAVKAGIILTVGQNYLSNTNLEQLPKVMEEIMQSTIYAKQHIPKHLRGIHANLSAISSMSSLLTLSLNPKSFMRELFQGSYNNYFRLVTKFAGKDGPEIKHLMLGYAFVSEKGIKALNNDNLMTALNMRFNISGLSMDEMKETHRANRSNLVGAFFRSGAAYTFNRAPDYLNRMGLFMSFMYKKDIVQAYSVVNDIATYDFNKDPRFIGIKEYYKTGKMPSNPTALSTYELMREEFNKRIPDGENKIKPGEALPEGFTDSEIESIINITNQIHGNMDDNTKMHLLNYFMVRTMLKFKTYMGAKLLNYTLKPGKYQNYEAEYLTDPETGKEIYLKTTRNEDGSIGEPEYTTDYDDPECTKQRVMKMNPRMEVGAFYAIGDLMSILINPENRSERWDALKNDNARMAGLRFATFDLFVLLIGFVFGELADVPELKKTNIITADMLEAALSVTKENNPMLLAASILDIINPTDYRIGKKIVTNTVNFLTSEDYETVDYMYKTFGFGKTFKYIL